MQVNCKWLSANVDCKLMGARYNDKQTGGWYMIQSWASPLSGYTKTEFTSLTLNSINIFA